MLSLEKLFEDSLCPCKFQWTIWSNNFGAMEFQFELLGIPGAPTAPQNFTALQYLELIHFIHIVWNTYSWHTIWHKIVCKVYGRYYPKLWAHYRSDLSDYSSYCDNILTTIEGLALIISIVLFFSWIFR